MNDRVVVCADLTAALDSMQRDGYRLDVIYPADDPHTAILTLDGDGVRLTSRPDAPAPSGDLAPFVPDFVLTRGGRSSISSSGEGRAGMLYRDLIPSRLGGRYIASHITIPEGGPVADWVHFHRILFQIIVVRRGWVRLVYEDQGAPFVMNAGDVVLQPPGIRHRVLESSPGLEVVEISCPALHETFAVHDMTLPNGRVDHERDFDGQRFVHHVAAQTPWTPLDGGAAQQTAVYEASGGLADVCMIKAAGSTIEFPRDDRELVFGFVLEGSARLAYGEGFDLGPGDAFVIPPPDGWALKDQSADLRLVLVTSSSGLAISSRSPL